MEIDVVMPIQQGRYVPEGVFASLISQRVSVRLFVSTKFQFNVALARNDVKRLGQSEMVLMLDNDSILPDCALVAMVEALNLRNEFGAIALPRLGFQDEGEYIGGISEPEHVGMSCVLWRLEELSKIQFRLGPGCECLNACLDLRATGKRIGFINLPCEHVDTSTAQLEREIQRAKESQRKLEDIFEGLEKRKCASNKPVQFVGPTASVRRRSAMSSSGRRR